MKTSSLKSGTAAIEAEIVNLKTRHDTLDKRRADAEAKLQAVKTARRNVLSGDPSADLGNLNRDVRDAEDEIETLDGVLFDLREQLADAETRLTIAKDQGERTKVAKQLEAMASAFDAGAAELASAIALVEKAARKMVDVLPETLHVVDFRTELPDGQTERERLVASILAEGIAKALPFAVTSRMWGAKGSYAHLADLRRAFSIAEDSLTTEPGTSELLVEPTDVKSAAAVIVSDRLRSRAQRVVAGEIGTDLADKAPLQEAPKPMPRAPEVEFATTKHFSYPVLDASRGRTIVTRFSIQQLPELVADAAEAAGVGFRTDTPEGAAKRVKLDADRRSMHSISPIGGVGLSDCVPVDVDWSAYRTPALDLRDVA